MEVVENSFRLGKKAKIRLLCFLMYFLAAFSLVLLGIKIIHNSNAVYAKEAAAATQTLFIPTISLSAPVIESQFTGKDLTVPDQIAASYSAHSNKTLLFGHSSTIFRDLQNLNPGAEVYFAGKKYQITQREEKKKSDISMQEILREEQTDTIVLMTCSGNAIPGTNGDHTHRLIFTATIVEE